MEAGTIETPTELARSRPLVLLGEPGMGKTTALQSIRDETPPTVDIDGTQIITAAAFDEVLGAPLRAALAPAGQGSRRDVLCIIDQVDESPELARLGRYLRTIPRDLHGNSFRLAMACRTADLPSDLIAAVTDLCGSPYVADLLPLSRAEAEELASSARVTDGPAIDGEDLVSAAVAAGAGAFAATPLTLKLLVSQYVRDGTLSSRAEELYSNGAEELAQEWQRTRAAQAEFSVNERLAVAEEIAARLVLTGRRTIWIGPVAEADPHHDLRKDLAIAPDPITGSIRKLEEALTTALFTGRGTDRLGFAHSSFAAYLAARFLVRADPPERQLRSLFLVPAGEGRFGIPVALRETAAWLVTLKTKHAKWLVDADAESLAAHRSALDTPGVRKLIVDVLLRRADEVELSNRWGYQYRSFGHPELGKQLGEVLDETANSDPTAWPTIARMRLVLRLATGEILPELTQRLLTVAAASRWPAQIRARAASIAAQVDIEASGPVLQTVLADLGSEGPDEREDPRDEIRFTILDALWPSQLTTSELLPQLLRPATESTSSAARALRRRFAKDVPDSEIADVMRWAAAQSQAHHDNSHLDWESDEKIGALPEDLAYDLIDRAFAVTLTDAVLADAATILSRPTPANYRPLPLALAAVGTDGHESSETRDQRRRFALALVRTSSEFTRFHASEVAYGWGSIQPLRYRIEERPLEGYSERNCLLDVDDFAWAYHLINATDDVSTRYRLLELASVLARQDRMDVVELLVSDPSHPLYERLRWVLETELNTHAAEHSRKQYEREQADERPVPGFETTELLRILHRHLDAVLAGDTEKFINLLYGCHYDPTTGRRNEEVDGESLVDLPAARALDREYELTEACLAYLNNPEEGQDRWLGTNSYPLRWWAAELAFAHLIDQGAIEAVDDAAWNDWIGVIVEYHYTNGGQDESVSHILMDRLYRYCPVHLADALRLYVRRATRSGKWAGVVACVAPARAPEVASAYQELLAELTEALVGISENQSEPVEPPIDPPNGETQMQVKSTEEAVHYAEDLWRDLFAGLQKLQPEECRALALQLLNGRGRPGGGRLAALAGGSLMLAESDIAWPVVEPLAADQPDLARRIAFACGDSGARIERRLTEEQVADLYRWLAILFPPETERLSLGGGSFGSRERAWGWRDGILGRLADRGTTDAVAALRTLSLEHPGRLGIKAALFSARRQVSELHWRQPTPEAIGTLLANPYARLVESDEQLAQLVVDALDDLQRDLPQIGELLWDRIAKQATGKTKDRWTPKNEAAIGAFLAHELRARLARGVAVNREVFVVPTSPDGAYNRIDIKVEAHDKRNLSARPPTVMVELKGSWHPKLRIAQDSQLRSDYLSTTGISSGVYVAAWFNPNHWSDDVGDTRRTGGALIDLNELKIELTGQAEQLGDRYGVTLHPILLAVDLPSPVANR